MKALNRWGYYSPLSLLSAAVLATIGLEFWVSFASLCMLMAAGRRFAEGDMFVGGWGRCFVSSWNNIGREVSEDVSWSYQRVFQ